MRLGLGASMVAVMATVVSATSTAGAGGGSAAAESGRLTASVAGHAIAIARGDGGGRRILASGGESFISPDGALVAVTDYDEGKSGATNRRVEFFSAAGGSPTHVIRANCTDVYWSPDSTRVSCVDFNLLDKPSRLLLINAKSGGTTTLGKGYYDFQVSFSPDSRSLAYVQYAKAFAPSGTLKLVDLATRAGSTVRSGAAAPLWGASAIAFSTVKPRPNGYPITNVAVMQPDGGGFRQLTNIRPSFLQGGLVPIEWSADGKRLLAGQGGQDTWLAYAVDPVRGGARKISPRVTPDAITPDGRFVIGDTTGGEDFGPERANVVRVPWAGGRATVLLRNAVAPSYSAAAKPVTPTPISSRCSSATALKVATQFQLGVDPTLPKPIAQVLCGAFVGPGSNAMVASIAIPSCGRTAQWAVFRWTGTGWQLVLTRNNGADLDAVGSDIRETQFVLRPADAHCFPTGGTRSRIWHWNGKRFVASPWKAAP
jgi:hypothetical protein